MKTHEARIEQLISRLGAQGPQVVIIDDIPLRKEIATASDNELFHLRSEIERELKARAERN